MYWNPYSKEWDLKDVFLPVRGGVLKSWNAPLSRWSYNSSPCGEVYWNSIENGNVDGFKPFLPVRGGVLKSFKRHYFLLPWNSSPCGEVYWNPEEYYKENSEEIPPRAGRCIEINFTFISFFPFTIPPRAGRCIEILYITHNYTHVVIPPRAGRCIEIQMRGAWHIHALFLPVRGGVLKFCVSAFFSSHSHSSPCGEVYWNISLSIAKNIKSIPPRAGRCIEIARLTCRYLTTYSSPCGEVYWNLINNRVNNAYAIPPRAGRCIEIIIHLVETLI